MEHGYLNEVLILLAVAIAMVALFRRIHLPPILGYLAVGLIAGPYGLGWLAFGDLTRFLGELGIVFLLFTIGLEFSWPLLLSMRKELFGVGSLQVTGGALAGSAIALAFGEPWQAALIFGAATAMSSTAIVLKQLAEQMELSARHGRLSVGILLFQDLAAIPFLIMIPILAASEGHLAATLGAALFKGALVLLIVVILGRKVLPLILHHTAAARSGELFTLTALFIALATAWFTGLFGLSLPLGAFLAGMLLGETAYRHQVEADVRPFRDLLLGLFFVAVGMELDYQVLPAMWLETLVLVVGMVLGKGLLIMLLVRAMGHEPGIALRTGIVLGHGGEFGIALLALALAHGLVDSQTMQPVLAAMIISMLIASLLVRENEAIVHRLAPRALLKRSAETAGNALGADTEQLSGHVIIAGYGRMGQNISAILRTLGVDYTALDLSPDVVKEAREAGRSVYFGNAVHRSLLDAAGIEHAQAIIISFDDPKAVERALHTARTANPSIYTVVRARDVRDYATLAGEGADAVIPEALEASMAMTGQLLKGLGFADTEVEQLVDRVRQHRYQELREHCSELDMASGAVAASRLRAVVLPTGTLAVDRHTSELELDEIGVKVIAVRRPGVRDVEQDAELRLKEGDVLILEGGSDALERAERHLITG